MNHRDYIFNSLRLCVLSGSAVRPNLRVNSPRRRRVRKGGAETDSAQNWYRITQLVVVLLCALTLKLYYSTASPNQLRWILAPTTILVEVVSGTKFEFESQAGYMSSDHTFLIAASCAGVNFLITSFLVLSLRKLWRDRSLNTSWILIPSAALFAYVATLVANTVRISTALRLRRLPLELSWLSPDQLHRLEGIFIYFGFLLLLFMVGEKMSSKKAACASMTRGLVRQALFPLVMYYTTTLGIPLANGAYRQGADFWEHSFVVLLTPLLLIIPLAIFRFCKDQGVESSNNLGTTSRAINFFRQRLGFEGE
jgi:exosortase K